MQCMEVFDAIASPKRREILRLLAGGELSAGEIASHFSVTQPAISQHLAALKGAGLVAERREGKFAYYRVDPVGLAPLSGASAMVWGDRNRLKQVLVNLLDNAIKYTPEGGQVTVDVKAYANRVQLTVTDSGIGIAPEALPHIYDRFFRAVPQHVEGSGLGLSIAKAIAERYGFVLEVANRTQGGVVATVIFPAKV